jgi:hypothetical protein
MQRTVPCYTSQEKTIFYIEPSGKNPLHQIKNHLKKSVIRLKMTIQQADLRQRKWFSHPTKRTGKSVLSKDIL